MKYTTQELIDHSKCFLLPTRPLNPFPFQGLLNRTFEAWQRCWVEVGEKTEFIYNADEFYRQDTVLVLMGPEDEIMGCHLYSFFNTENLCSTNHSFFQRFDAGYKNYLLDSKVSNSFSVEYLTVSKEFRGYKDLKLGRAIVSLSTQVLKDSLFDGILAQTRDDLKVNQLAPELGGEIVSTGFKMNGIDSSFILFRKPFLKESQAPTIKAFKDSLWSRRMDLTGLTISPSTQEINPIKQRGVA